MTTRYSHPPHTGLQSLPLTDPPAGGRISAREIEVLALIAAGFSNKQIASELDISINTVARHVTNIMRKMPACNRVDAAVTGMKRGLIAP